VRVAKDKLNPYVMLNKQALHDERLSWKAKGLWAYMLSLPDDWQFRLTELATHAKDGEGATNSALRELEKCGYLAREQKRDEKGKITGTDYVVAEVSSTTQFSSRGFSSPGKLPPTNNDLTNTDITNTTYPRNVDSETIPYDTIVQMYNEVCTSLPKVTKLTDARRKHLRARWQELGSTEEFGSLFQTVENSAFLTGKNDRGWRADFDWIIASEQTVTKIQEGRYSGQPVTPNGPTTGRKLDMDSFVRSEDDYTEE
jgi:hypothetical protein